MDFYCLAGSPPCGSINMTAAALGVKLNKITIDYANGDHLKPEFLKLNPQHTVPTLVDNGFSIWESRAIMGYLVEKYGKDDTLYPKCAQKRAVVNQRLFYDMTLYSTFADYFYPQLMAKAPADPVKCQKMEDTFAFLNTFLEGQTYVAGDALTIADISLISTVSSFVVAGAAATGFDISKYPNVAKWFDNCKKVAPAFEESWQNSLELKKWFAGLN